ncbi:MAG: mannose-1-phosphate guanylyltransferase [Bacteroidetes bacterium]|nr:mannose-1-phosphate guanylyltransferase [Bacteroidota bacterium]
MSENIAVIMAGGIGSRFWPVSRSSHPKQFLDILGTGKSLIQMTFKRISNLFDKDKIYVVTNKEYFNLIKKQLPDLLTENILLEPALKNTAPCIAYSVYKIYTKFPEANIAILPSDHLITDELSFGECIKKGLGFVSKSNAIVTLGITPTRPDTGYGYIQYIADEKNSDIFKVKTFTEKPTAEIAETFIQSGDFLWNSGIFISNVKTWIDSFQEFLPELHELFKAGKKFYYTQNEDYFIERSYPLCTVISIDFGIIEKAKNVWVIPSSFGWSDLGTWRSVKEIATSNENGNVVIGKNVFERNSENCLVFNSTKGVIALQGVKNLLIVESNDAILICNIEDEQEVKFIVSDIKEKYEGKYN